MAEIIGMLNKNGINAAKAMECLGDLPVISLAAKNAGKLMLMDNHSPMFPIDLVEKDFRYMAQTAEALDAPTPTSNAIRDIYLNAIALGYGKENITGVVRLFM